MCSPWTRWRNSNLRPWKAEKRGNELEKQLAEEEWAQIRAYREGLEEFHDRERRLTYENGFLLAVSLCLELSGQLEGMR